MSIIGRGDVASVLQDREGFTFFAAGLANREPISFPVRLLEFHKLADVSFANGNQDYWKDKMFVYFSSLSIYYADNEYTTHKLWVERMIKINFPNSCILRIGNITWGDNPNTLINSLKHKIKNNIPFEIQDTYRYLIDKDELLHWIDLIPRYGKHEMNVTGRRMKVAEIVKEIESGRL